MKMYPHPRDDAEHRRASAALPWLLNGTASEADRRFAEAHLQHCEDCRAEWQQQQRWQAAMTRPPAGETAPLPSPQAGLQRLWARIDTADGVVAAAPAGRRWPLPGAGVGQGSRAGRSAVLVYALMATVMVEAVALAVLGLEVAKPAAPGYRTLSSAPEAAVPPGSQRVVFDPGFTLGALQQLLADTGLQVVAGPNAAGAYVLAPRQAGGDAVAVTAVTARLRATPGVRLATPLPPAGSAP